MTVRKPAPLDHARRLAAPLVLAIALPIGLAAAPPAAVAADADLATALDTLFAGAYPADRPGAAVRIEKGGEVVLELEPGARWSYSNSGHFLLGAIVEAASATSYEELVETRILEPPGMERSRYGHENEVEPGRVEGYQWQPGGYERAEYLSMTQPYAAGSLLSTVDDLARWDAAPDGPEEWAVKTDRPIPEED